MKKFLSAFMIIAMVTVSGCAGRTPAPVMSKQLGDNQLSCEALQIEMEHINQQVNALIPESKKTGKNVALGVAGFFLLVPWFFMDFSDAEKMEIKAYQERYVHLQQVAADKKCE